MLQEYQLVAHQAGYRQGYAAAVAAFRAVAAVGLVCVLAMIALASQLVSWQVRAESSGIGQVYERVRPAVVTIQVKSAGDSGTGIVIDRAGFVLTNYHVIMNMQNDEDVVVQLPQLGQLAATVVGYDLATDLAVLKVNAPPDQLTAARFGDSRRVRVGDLAIAIGNPFGLTHSVTVGYISSVNRRLASYDPYGPDVEGALQTDAAINPGNSGGPLLNAGGEVIGINSRIEPAGVGLGFAIPSDTALRVAREIIAQGCVRRPFLGAGGRPVSPALARQLGLPAGQGLLIQQVDPGSPAARIGLRAGRPDDTTDVILALDGRPVRSQSDLNHLVAGRAIGDQVELEILRNGRRMTLPATLSQRPQTDLEGVPSPHAQPVRGN